VPSRPVQGIALPLPYLLLSLIFSVDVCKDASPTVGISFLKINTVIKTKLLGETGGLWERRQL
jgi:hypothetical protein